MGDRGDGGGALQVTVDAGSEFLRSEGEDRIEEDQKIGSRGDGEVFGGFVEAGANSGTGGDVTSGGASGSDDTVGIDAEFGGVLSDPADGALGIGDAGIGVDFVAGFDAVVGAEGDKATTGEVLGLGFELEGGTFGPSSAEEEDNGGAFVGRLPVGREVGSEGEIGLGRFFVDEGFGRRGILGCEDVRG